MISGKRNVYEALLDRLKKIFEKSDYVYVAFSGGKDSGVLLFACIDFIRKYYPGKKLGVFHLDYEIQYSDTVEYVNRVFKANKDILEIFHVCIPVKVPTSTTMLQSYWRPWDPEMKHLWVRKQPDGCYTKEDFDFFNENLWDYDLNKKFAAWLKKKKGVRKICCLLGIRTQESYSRWRLIYSHYSSFMNGKPLWFRFIQKNIYNAYPIYDWLTTDVWTANGKFGWDFNNIYNLFYIAGISLEKQRVASPFILPAQQDLRFYKALDPDTWGKMLCRVNGVNFTGIYGGTYAMGWQHLKCPPDMTWKAYMHFLLKTLPEKTRKKYADKLKDSIEFWRNTGGCLDLKTIKELNALNIPIKVEKHITYKMQKLPVKMEYQDDIALPAFKELPTYKRVCICILKNDHCCSYMGYTPTKAEQERKMQIQKAFTSLRIESIGNPFID